MKKEPYYKIQKSIMHDPSITPQEKVILIFLYDRHALSLNNADDFKDEDGRLYCYLKIETLTEWTGLSRPAITRAMHKLEKAHLIETVRQGKKLPNRIYLNDWSCVQNETSQTDKVMSQNVTSRCNKTLHHSSYMNKPERIKPERKKEREEKSLSPFFTRARSDVIDLVCEMIGKRYLIHMMDDPKAQASNYYADRQQKKWMIGKNQIMTEEDLGLDLDKWNHKEWKFKRGGEVTKGKDKKQGEPEWMDEYMDDLRAMKG